MVHQKNNDNIIDIKEEKLRSNGNDRTQNHQKKTTSIFLHLIRADGLEKQILSGTICGTKSKGRQRTKYTNSLNNFVTRKESANNELIKRTDDREDWEAMIAMSATVLAHDDDDDVHLFDTMGDGPLFLITLLVFMVIVFFNTIYLAL